MNTDSIHNDGISRIAHSCRELFREIDEGLRLHQQVINRVSQLMKRSDTSHKSTLTLEDLYDEFEQYRVWARNLGVFASNQASLDYRLREAQDVKDGIVSLLKSLQADLNAILFLFYQDRTAETLEPEDFSETSDSSSDGSDLADGLSRSSYQLQARLQRVVETINKLMQVAKVIRASNPGARMTRAANYVHYENGINMSEQFEKEYMPLLLERRYKVKTSLIDRLVKAISLRRRKFQYQAKHQQRLAYAGDHGLETSRTNIHTSHHRHLPVGTPSSQPSSAQISASAQGLSQSNVLTVATTFKRLQVKKTTPSTIISASTRSTAAGPDIPPPPRMPPRATHFQCPYCCILMAERDFLLGRGTFSRQLWFKHVIADLQPYVCLEDDCQTPDVLLESQEEWLNHQKWQHAMEWWCEGDDVGHEPLSFNTADRYIEHVQLTHGKAHEVAAKQASIAGRPSLFPFNACPFCDFGATELAESSNTTQSESEESLPKSLSRQHVLQKHVADELVNLFLIALPERDDIKDIQTDTDRPAAKGSTVRALDNISLVFPDSTEESTLPLDRFPLEFAMSPDPYTGKGDAPEVNDWDDVWTSPQLQECVRSTYLGFEYDDTLQEMLATATKEDIELWVPTLMIEDEVLVQGWRLPRGVRSYYEDFDHRPYDGNNPPSISIFDEPGDDSKIAAFHDESGLTEDGKTSYAQFFVPQELNGRAGSSRGSEGEIID